MDTPLQRLFETSLSILRPVTTTPFHPFPPQLTSGLNPRVSQHRPRKPVFFPAQWFEIFPPSEQPSVIHLVSGSPLRRLPAEPRLVFPDGFIYSTVRSN